MGNMSEKMMVWNKLVGVKIRRKKLLVVFQKKSLQQLLCYWKWRIRGKKIQGSSNLQPKVIMWGDQRRTGSGEVDSSIRF